MNSKPSRYGGCFFSWPPLLIPRAEANVIYTEQELNEHQVTRTQTPASCMNSSEGGQRRALMCWAALGPGEVREKEPKIYPWDPRPKKEARALTGHGAGVKDLRVANDHSNEKGQKCGGQMLDVRARYKLGINQGISAVRTRDLDSPQGLGPGLIFILCLKYIVIACDTQESWLAAEQRGPSPL